MVGNFAGEEGGGVFNKGIMDVNECKIEGNSALESGGAIFFFQTAVAAVEAVEVVVEEEIFVVFQMKRLAIWTL